MAIYRPPKPRWPLAIAVGSVCLLIGTGIGIAIGNREPSAPEVAADLRADLISAAGSLEVAEIEYTESVSDGEITREAEYDGALGAIESSRTIYSDVAPVLGALAPSRSEEIEALYDDCSSAMRARSDASDVTECLTELSNLLKGET
ncbi:MAG: hypothetical protein ABR575_07385 [Actinomycetota bacterium]